MRLVYSRSMVSHGDLEMSHYKVRLRINMWGECGVLDLAEIVVGIFVQCEFPELPQWHLSLRPDLR
jgi:hypothetical protein